MQIKRILPLPSDVVGKIAAGEVVESPAAAIKEMVENSIDAGATAISIEIREGGIAYTRVTDNGCGIPASDIRMAFERHATSKIRTAEELVDMQTLGFRGEALASIAAVAKVTLTTRTQADQQGTRAVCAGGLFQEVTPASSPEGTTIVFEDLFFNTPARLKFLKKPRTEAGRVSDVVLRMIASRPDISFRLIVDGKQVYHSPGDGKLASAAFALYGAQVAAGMLPVKGESSGIALEGLVGVGELARASRSHQSFFINGRFVRHGVLSQALEAACQERVMVGHYPVCMLSIRMPGSWVDVNVHPNKLDVRFADEQRVYEVLRQVISGSFPRDALAHAQHMDQAAHSEPMPVQVQVSPVSQAAPVPNHATPQSAAPVPEKAASQPQVPFSELVQQYFSTMAPPPVRLRESSGTGPSAPKATPQPTFAPYAPPQAPQSAEVRPAAPPPIAFRVLGTLFHTYILIESQDRLLMIDQHAAHERALYEQMKAALDQGQASQQLLVAQVVPVTPGEAERLETYADAVRAAGFDIAMMGQDAVQVRAVPQILGEPQAREAFRDLLDHLGELRVLGTAVKRRDALIQMACKKAVKAGDQLKEAEIEALLRLMQSSDAPPTCPHGRPLIVVLSRQEIEKRFKRIQ